MRAFQKEPERQERLKKVNELIEFISSYGSHFFKYQNQIAKFVKPQTSKKIWYIDRYTQKKIYPYQQAADNPNFCEGYTLWCLVVELRKYIMDGIQLRSLFSEYWGYGEDEAKVINKAVELGIMYEMEVSHDT